MERSRGAVACQLDPRGAAARKPDRRLEGGGIVRYYAFTLLGRYQTEGFVPSSGSSW